MKILTVIGARPQFVKAAALSRALTKFPDIQQVIVHTGQHFDENMSQVFFRQMHIPPPKYNLGIGGLGHGAMTGRMLEQLEGIIPQERPDVVLVFGDTNSTLAGALAAAKLHCPVAHVEAGIRSFNMAMPEELNRVLTDRISRWLFCPTEQAVSNLKNEGYVTNSFHKIVRSGDVMLDAALFYADFAQKPADFSPEEKFVLATFHRAENTDNPQKLAVIVEALNELSLENQVVVPLHPRTRKILAEQNWHIEFMIIPPVGYLEMVWLLQHCALVMTDSGGLQKEAYFFKKPCVTLRDQTEWVELAESGVNLLVQIEKSAILAAFREMLSRPCQFVQHFYGTGNAAELIISELVR